MATKWQKEDIEIPKGFKPLQRLAVAEDIIDYILIRTSKGKDRNGEAFPKYSKAYKESLDFKNAGKTSRVDLELSGDMLAELSILQTMSGAVRIGYERGSEENAKADGNIRGTYGKKTPNKAKARDFLGIEPKALNKIISKHLNKPTEADRLELLPLLGKKERVNFAAELFPRRKKKNLFKLSDVVLEDLILGAAE